jgi:hypothetical protein
MIMTAFEQRQLFCVRQRFEWMDDDVLRYEYRSIKKKTVCLVPLFYLYPEPAIVTHRSNIAAFIAFLAFALLFIFAQTYVKDPDSWTLGGFVAAELCSLLVTLAAGFYFWNSTRKRMAFCYKNGDVVFELLCNDQSNAFKDELKRKSVQATFKADTHNIDLLKTEITQLTRDKVINRDFEDILYDRLMSVSEVTG